MNKAEIDNLLAQAKNDLLNAGSAGDSIKKGAEVKALIALTGAMVRIGDKFDKTDNQLNKLNQNLKSFNDNSSKLQGWLIFWTAAIALAAIISLFT